MMDIREKLYNPNTVVFASAALGLGAFADSISGGRLGLRGIAPEPFDPFNSGMSAAMGSVLASHHFSSQERKMSDTLNGSFRTVTDEEASPQQRHTESARMKRVWRAIGAGAIVAGSTYIIIGEIGSEAFHYFYDKRQEDVAPEEVKKLPLGHLDPYDLLYGIGAAVAVSKLEQRRKNNLLDKILIDVPLVKRPAVQNRSNTSNTRTNSGRPIQRNKRYTPPKSR